ncbi:MAG: flavin reductase domain protein FMN-binding protein [Moraxellaceae bacterium]|jgi:flavin reductase (DIM6/NTAB) family NADH-FMN oxidoreductase RutF|nr:flavin reductase domain protein FMN-binding protein [Moraxellaceae bacterium]
MNIDPATHSAGQNYKLLTNIVVPRPIAWVTSTSPEGIVNLAPFSFFNAIGSDPLLVMISVAHNSDGSLKHTGRNIVASGEFVVNMVTPELMDAMNLTSADFPDDESELLAAGLAPAASEKVAVPRVAAAKAALECRLHSTLPFGNYTVLVGEVVMFHVADALLDDKLHIHGFDPVGRLGSPAFYCHTQDRFEMPRQTYAQWKDATG